MTTVLIADDHAIVRAGLRLLIERDGSNQVVAEAADGREAVRLASAHTPRIAVMDIAMPLLNGIEAARQISKESPRTAVIVLSMHCDVSYVVRALRAGVKGYVLKESAESELLTALDTVASGRTFFSAKVSTLLDGDAARRMRQQAVPDTLELLTAREREVLQLVGEGKANKEIATLLGVSLTTVETHRANMLEKLDLHSTADLILFAVRNGMAG
ncbi:MAG: response regulator transcription factor [Acidobacteria bacterium]|nr:response regulator transcription factor [Acidobacteriota bacterium]